MTVELKAETERLVRQEIRSGHFQSVDELIVERVRALREKSKAAETPRKPRKNLADFLLESPFAGSELNLERERDYGRSIDL
jgi:Arc/MetJ-type ribon-helix-helix transcriptional regulator